MAWGGNPWAICGRCGRKRRHSALRREWTQLLVCGECWDSRPAQLDPPRLDPREGAPIREPRPEPDPAFVSDDDPVNLDGDWTQPLATAQPQAVFASDDDPVTADDL